MLEYGQEYYQSNFIYNILRVDNVRIVNGLVQENYVNGIADNVIYSFSPSVESGFKIVKEMHNNLVYLPVITKIIDRMTT